jgi:NAD(P)-dependent dehydrogenase (short-subunit alcohol dehydrogenase family)
MMNRIDPVWLITGCSTGFGRELARLVLERGWRAVQARITETGDLVDVCTGTGAGRNATREYYLTRPAITGPDDRGGAMALTAALEMHALRAPR